MDRGYLTVNGTSVAINQLKVINNGTGQADQSKVGVYLSLDQNFSTADFLIGKTEIPKLASGSSYAVNFQANVSQLGIPAGDYFVGIVIDNDKQVEETNEGDNNTCSWSTPKVHVAQSLPNLFCFDRGHLTISNTKLNFNAIKIQNNGNAFANASAVGFYLSNDNAISSGDIFIGAVTIPGLNAGQTATMGSFTIDVDFLNLANGTYTIGFIVDYNNLVGESNENDNNGCSYEQKLIIQNGKPNLVCDYAGEVAVVGTKIDISWLRVKNDGNAKAGATRVGYYLSTDQHFTTSDYFIGSSNLPELSAYAVANVTPFSLDVSGLNIPAGSYFVGVIIDDTNKIAESNESDNNTCSFSHPKVTIASPKPNLTCVNLGELTVNGSSVHISWSKIQNTGGSTSNSTKVGYYLSTDTHFTPSDFLIGTAELPALLSGEVKTLPSFNTNLDYFGLPSGTYYVGIFIDPTYLVTESNENDNNTCFWTHPQVHISQGKPNLTCMNRGEISAYGSVITFSWIKIQNNGSSSAGANKIGYYLSSDTHFSTNDIFVGEGYIPSIGAGQVYSVPDFTVNLSNLNLASGEYFLGFIIDYQNQVSETNEDDNNDCFYTTPKVVVNAPKSNLTCKDKGELSINGNSLHHSWGKIMNNGGTTAGASYVGYYLSTDLNFDTNDKLIGEAYISSLAPGQVASLPDFNISIASLGLPSGTYYFGFIADYKYQVSETDEYDNNDCFFEHPRVVIQSASGKADLTCANRGEIIVNGTTINISWVKVVNNGSITSGNSRIGYYLSTDLNFTTGDQFIGSKQISSLAPGQTITIDPLTINVEHLGIPSGSYFVGYIIDDENKVAESNENNNNDCYFEHPKVVIPGNSGGGNNNSSCKCEYFTASAFCEDFEAYNTGGLNLKSNCFETWTGALSGSTDGIIASSNGGNQYLKIEGQGGQAEQNIVLQLGDRTAGKYNLQFKMWLFAGDKGYFNVLHAFIPNGSYNKYAYEVYFSGNNSGYVKQGGQQLYFQYPTSTWFTVNQYYDIDNDEVRLSINGVVVGTWKFSNTPTEYYNQVLKRLAAINFRALGSNDQYFVDDIQFTTVSNADASVEARGDEISDANATAPTFEITYYPNPVKDKLTVTFTATEVKAVQFELINAIGQVVKRHVSSTTTELTHEFDVNDLPKGMYYLRAIAGEEQITKPIAIIE